MKKNTSAWQFCCLIAMQIGAPASATTIAASPIDTASIVPPNIIFGLDDSGSMDFEVIQNANDGALWYDKNAMSFANASGVLNFNTSGTSGASGGTTWYKYAYLFPNGSNDDARNLTDNQDHFAMPPTPAYSFIRSPDYNPLYYNPGVTYLPWMPAYVAGASKTFANASVSTPRSHPIFPSGGSTPVTSAITTLLASTATDATFKMVPGMVIPGNQITGILGSRNGGGFLPVTSRITVAPGDLWDVAIPYVPATYWLKDASCGTGWPACISAPDGALLRRYEIKAGATFPSGRSYAAELQNFANWFQYYRKRKLMIAASMGRVLSQLTSIRGAVVRINGLAGVTMSDFSSTDPSKNWQAVLGSIYQNPANGGTPTREALNYIGKQYQRTDASAPIQYACQRNAVLMLTDGFANASSNVTVPAYARATYGAGAPYQTTYANTLADIGLYFYSTNLRPDLAQNQVPLDTSSTLPNPDNNRNLHMDTYGLTLGGKGTIYNVDQAKTAAPFSYAPVWPNPSTNYSPTSIDDLWHATINGRGLMLSATDSASTVANVQRALTDVLIKAGAQSAIGVSRVTLKAGDSVAYVSSYQVNGWYGELQARTVDEASGLISGGAPIWSAQALVDAMAPTERRIAITEASGTAVPFRSNSVSAATKTALQLSAAPSDADDVLNYLRGERGKESTLYRPRQHLLGDLVHSEPSLVKGALAAYLDTGYAGFASTIASRKRMLYQGSNDGMLHAFDAANGAELWAYIPSFMLPGLKNLASKSYAHQFYVDASAVSGDVDFGAGAWHTILVSGLQAGGKGFFALDVTNPVAGDENAVAQKFLWQFPNATTPAVTTNSVGLSFGKPIIAKITGQGWVVIVSSGYNNGADGKGHVFVLNAKTGALIADIATSVGSLADPAGLAQLSAFAPNGQADATIDTVYGGDLKGNLWRFNLVGAPASWSAVLLAQLTDGSNAQPITSAPELSNIATNAGVKRMVFVGTGQLLSTADIATMQTQSFYGIVDDGTATPTIAAVRSALLRKNVNVSGNERRIVDAALDYTRYKGWYVDLGSSERVSSDPQMAFGTIVFTANRPSPSACSGASILYAVKAASGGDTTPLPGQSGQPAGQLLGLALASRPIMLLTTTGTVRIVTHLTDNSIVNTELPINITAPPRTMAWKPIIR
jgi:type IV pilus assembly protein PilY1